MNDVFQRIEAAIRRDPGRRGLLGEVGGPLGLGELETAAKSLAAPGTHAVIVTGFFIPLAEPAAAETDGPPGAVALAETLRRLSRSATLVTDPFCGPAVRAAAAAADLPDSIVRVLQEPSELAALLERSSPRATHLIAIERVGPGYTDDVLRSRCGAEAALQFAECVPRELWSRCLNMRGVPIEEWTVDFSAVFEAPPAGVTTIGLGDGGNELGLGKFSWCDLRGRLDAVADPRILCRVAADHAIVAGTSNWAAYGLAAATAFAAEQPEAFAGITSERQQHVLERMVRDGPAVDGVSRRFEPTVDGLPLLTYFEPLEAIHRRLRKCEHEFADSSQANDS
ncbi:MAG: glutamate cyclase domain-containing protein [Planctomycetaceae bacterium]